MKTTESKTVNTGINWLKPIALQDGRLVKVISNRGDNAFIEGAGFICLITKSTGLPISDVLNWDLFPVQNITKE